ncbi:MAG: hypothetical protein P8049_09110, partial [Gemmatimonadota bacterium]
MVPGSGRESRGDGVRSSHARLRRARRRVPGLRLASLGAHLLSLLAPIQTRAVAQDLRPTTALDSRNRVPARDTLFLVGDARIDPGLAALGRNEPNLVTAAWRRALGFVEWTDGAVLVADGASNYVELARQ